MQNAMCIFKLFPLSHDHLHSWLGKNTLIKPFGTSFLGAFVSLISILSLAVDSDKKPIMKQMGESEVECKNLPF